MVDSARQNKIIHTLRRGCSTNPPLTLGVYSCYTVSKFTFSFHLFCQRRKNLQVIRHAICWIKNKLPFKASSWNIYFSLRAFHLSSRRYFLFYISICETYFTFRDKLNNSFVSMAISKINCRKWHTTRDKCIILARTKKRQYFSRTFYRIQKSSSHSLRFIPMSSPFNPFHPHVIFMNPFAKRGVLVRTNAKGLNTLGHDVRE